MELLTAAQMRAIEQAAIDSGEVTGLELMERAGAGVVEAIFEWRPELAECERRAVVLCGPGNNGGDGFVVARLLKQRGWAIEVFLYGDETKLPPDAAENYRRWLELGGTGKFEEYEREHYHSSTLTIDALFGTGLTRALPESGIHNHLWDIFDGDDYGNRPMIVAIDCPSGLCLDSGRLLGWSGLEDRQDFILAAALTVTFHKPKLGHYLAIGPRICGDLAVKDIGL